MGLAPTPASSAYDDGSRHERGFVFPGGYRVPDRRWLAAVDRLVLPVQLWSRELVSVRGSVHEPGFELRSIDLHASKEHSGDLPRVLHVIQRIRVQHYEVGTLSRGHHAKIVLAEDFSRRSPRCNENLRGRNSGHNHVFQFRVHCRANELVALLAAAIGPYANFYTCLLEPHDALCQTIPRLLAGCQGFPFLWEASLQPHDLFGQHGLSNQRVHGIQPWRIDGAVWSAKR